MGTPAIIRPADAADVPAMATIRAAEWETQAYWERRIAGYLEGTHHPQHALSERAVFVAEEDGAVAGFVAGHRTQRLGCDGELEWINVAAAHRGRGIAEQLMVAMARWFVEQHAFRICVNVAPENARAVALYTKFGAQPLEKFWMVWPDIRVAFTPADSAEPPAP